MASPMVKSGSQQDVLDQDICAFGAVPLPEVVRPVLISDLRKHYVRCDLRVGFWQNGFFTDFFFLATGFFRGFYRRMFSPHFCGKKCPDKSSRKITGKILQNFYDKSPRHISAEGPGQVIAASARMTRLWLPIWHGYKLRSTVAARTRMSRDPSRAFLSDSLQL